MFPATMKAHRTRDPCDHEYLETPLDHHRIPSHADLSGRRGTLFFSAKARLHDRISASPHAGATANLGNSGTRQTFIAGLVGS